MILSGLSHGYSVAASVALGEYFLEWAAFSETQTRGLPAVSTKGLSMQMLGCYPLSFL